MTTAQDHPDAGEPRIGRPKRWRRVIIIAVGASLLINALLFLWIALLSDSYTSTAELRYTRVSDDVRTIENTVWMRERYQFPPSRPFNIPLPVPLGVETQSYRLTDEATLPAAAVEATFLGNIFEDADGRYLESITTTFTAGVPLRCFRSVSRLDYGTDAWTETNLEGIPLPGWVYRVTALTRVNHTWPSTILWPQLLANLILWAAFVALAILGWGRARRVVRRFRTRTIPDPCPACSYPMGGLDTCPECGTERMIPGMASN